MVVDLASESEYKHVSKSLTTSRIFLFTNWRLNMKPLRCFALQASVAAMLLLILVAPPELFAQKGEMSITTSSKEALNLFMQGRDKAENIEQAAAGALTLNQGTIYPALLRLEQKGWIGSEWGTSDNNRRARFYAITRSGRRQLATEAALWARTVSIVNRLLEDGS